MRIKNIRWENFKKLADNNIAAEGKNVVIRGQNGVGKSSIAQILPFVLFGKITGSVKKFDNGWAPTDDGLIHAAEIAFDDGSTLRREYFWAAKSNAQQFFINGKTAKATQFKTHVEKITNGGGELVFNPFAFADLPAKDQRDLLINIFGDVRDADILSDDEKKIFGGLSADTFIAQTKTKLISPKRELADIPARQSELHMQLSNLPDNLNAHLADTKSKLADLKAKREKLSQPLQNNFKTELDAAINAAKLLKAGKENHAVTIENLKTIRATLRDAYQKVKAQKAGTCPTCGQPIPNNISAALRDDQLIEIQMKGEQNAADIKRYEELLEKVSNDFILTENKIKDLEIKAREESASELNRRDELTKIDNSINDLQAVWLKLKNATEIQTRIDALTNRYSDLEKQIAELEKLIKLGEDVQTRKINAVEEKINSHFSHVKFKLFNLVISTGEAKPTCEAMLHGVPYSALSKGERLKAALDIFKALQNFYGVEMPLFIDDAESYTLNSFVELPNQIWLFKVSDDKDLTIKIGD